MLVDEDDRELYLQALDPNFQPGTYALVSIAVREGRWC